MSVDNRFESRVANLARTLLGHLPLNSVGSSESKDSESLFSRYDFIMFFQHDVSLTMNAGSALNLGDRYRGVESKLDDLNRSAIRVQQFGRVNVPFRSRHARLHLIDELISVANVLSDSSSEFRRGLMEDFHRAVIALLAIRRSRLSPVPAIVLKSAPT
jgi:hypothetical protein